MRKKILIGLGALVGLFIIIGIIAVATSGDEPAPGTVPAQAPAQTVTQLTPEQELTSIIEDALGDSNREGIEKISGIDIVNAGFGYNVDVHYAINDNLSEDWIIDGARLEIRDTLEALYTSGKDIQWVDMYGSFSMVDKYGNAEEKEVMHVRLGRDTASKINWENITKDMLFDILDFKDIHPVFNK